MRPSIGVLYGTLCHFFPEHAVGNHYSFLTVFVAVGVIVLAGLMQALAPCLAAWKAILYSSAVLIGFWGQYILDINAWSQIAWSPLIIYSASFPLLRVRKLAKPSSPDNLARWWIPWLVALVATVYIYPEGALFSFVPLLTLTIFCMAQGPLVPLAPSIGHWPSSQRCCLCRYMNPICSFSIDKAHLSPPPRLIGGCSFKHFWAAGMDLQMSP